MWLAILPRIQINPIRELISRSSRPIYGNPRKSTQLRKLPPALIINVEFDVLRDEGEAYAHKLIEAGVPVTGLRYHGTIHDFVMLNPLSDTPAARGAIEQASQMLKKILSDWK